MLVRSVKKQTEFEKKKEKQKYAAPVNANNDAKKRPKITIQMVPSTNFNKKMKKKMYTS